MKKLLLIFGILLIYNISSAQEIDAFQRMKGLKLKSNLYIQYDTAKKAFQYRRKETGSFLELNNAQIFNVKNGDNNNVKIFFEFKNPLRYNVKITVKDVDDQSYKTLMDFFSKLPESSIFGTIVDKTKSSLPGFMSGVPDEKCKNQEFPNSILLYEWIERFKNLQTIRKVIQNDSSNCRKYNKLFEIILQIKNTEDELYGNLTLGIAELSGSKAINKWIKDETASLYKCNDYFSFKNTLNISKQISDKLKDHSDKQKTDLNALLKSLNENFDNDIALFFTDENSKKDFKTFSKITTLMLTNNTKSQLETIDVTIKRFNDLTTKLDKYLADFKGKNGSPLTEQVTINNVTTTKTTIKMSDEGYRVDFEGSLNDDISKMKSVDYSITSIDKSGTEDTKSTVKSNFIVARRLSVFPFISTGLLYTPKFDGYPNYAVGTDAAKNNIVAQTTYTKTDLKPAVFLNLLINTKVIDDFNPFIQLGISAGANDAIFPVGIGIAYQNSFSISGGLLFGTYKGLNKLTVDGPVKDDAALKNDLIDKSFSTMYFSIHYNLTKK